MKCGMREAWSVSAKELAEKTEKNERIKDLSTIPKFPGLPVFFFSSSRKTGFLAYSNRNKSAAVPRSAPNITFVVSVNWTADVNKNKK